MKITKIKRTISFLLCVLMVTTLMPMGIFTVSAASLPDNWEILEGSGLELGTNVFITEEGYLEIGKNEAGNQIGLAYTKDLPDSYTFEVDVFIPAGSVDPLIAGGVEPFIAIGASSYTWVNAAAFVYRMHNWLNPNFGYAFGHYGVGHMDFILGTETTTPEYIIGGWNTIKIQVDDGYANFFLNGNVKIIAIDLFAQGSEGIGEYILLGQEYNQPTNPAPSELPMFRNVKITTDAGTETYFDTPITPDEPDEPAIPESYRPTILGAQYRITGEPGLRFGTKVNVTKQNAETEGINGKVTLKNASGEATIGNIKRMGTLLIPADKLGDADLVITADGKVNGVRYLDIVMKKLYIIKDKATDEGYVTFNVVMLGVPDARPGGANYTRKFTAVSYIEYNDGTIIYSEPISRSIADVANNLFDNEEYANEIDEWWN